MSVVELLSWSTVALLVLTAFVLGAAPVFAVRCIARIYPKGHTRRLELVAEMSYVTRNLPKTLELWRWMGESAAIAMCEGIPARIHGSSSPRLVTLVVRNEGGLWQGVIKDGEGHVVPVSRREAKELQPAMAVLRRAAIEQEQGSGHEGYEFSATLDLDALKRPRHRAVRGRRSIVFFNRSAR